MTIAATDLVPAAISAISGLLVWLLIQRNVERRDVEIDTLRNIVQDLRDHRVGSLESELAGQYDDVNKRLAAAADARKELHREIAAIRETFVTKASCETEHRKLMGQLGEYRESVLKLERVSERTDMALARGEQLLAQIIHVESRVSALAGKLEQLTREGGLSPA